MAHELTHVVNRDVVIMTIASFFASIASMITQFGFFFGGAAASAAAAAATTTTRAGRWSSSSRWSST